MDEHQHLLSGWRFRAMVITIVIAAIGYLIFSLWGGWENVVAAISHVGFYGVLLALVLSLFNYGLRFVRWQHFLHVLGYDVPILSSLRIYVAGFSLTTTPGKAGEALRGVFLADFGVPFRRSFGALLAERISDLNAIVILAATGLWIFPEARLLVIIAGLFVVILLYIVQKDTWLQAAERFALKRLPGRFAHIIEFLIETVLAFRSCFKPRVLVAGILLGCLAWGAEGTAFYCLLQLSGYDVPFLTAVFIFTFSLLVGAVTLIPGGLGTTEIAMLQLLLLNGVPKSGAVAITLLIRLCTLWFSVLLGLIALPKKQIVIKKQTAEE